MLRNLLTGIFGGVAYADYRSLNCPDANQCSDALMVWQTAAIFAVGGLILIAILWLIRPMSRRQEGQSDA